MIELSSEDSKNAARTLLPSAPGYPIYSRKYPRVLPYPPTSLF